ncbi:MAG: endonuclease V, partial [Thermoplasmata archaeon]
VLKSREGCNPIFISPGHKISLKTGIEVVKKCLRGHKLPEPTRLAHKFVNISEKS